MKFVVPIAETVNKYFPYAQLIVLIIALKYRMINAW